ncbi:hypothetical protein [Atlanticothrix silvestris]|nr:hypothetical protein [Atlanticothrix silvestris]
MTIIAPNLGKLFAGLTKRPATPEAYGGTKYPQAPEDIALLALGDWISEKECPWSWQFKRSCQDMAVGAWEGKEFFIPHHLLMVCEVIEGQVVEKFFRRESNSKLTRNNAKPGTYIVDRLESLGVIKDDLGFGFVVDWLSFGKVPNPPSGKKLTYNWQRDSDRIAKFAIASSELVTEFLTQNECTQQFKVSEPWDSPQEWLSVGVQCSYEDDLITWGKRCFKIQPKVKEKYLNPRVLVDFLRDSWNDLQCFVKHLSKQPAAEKEIITHFGCKKSLAQQAIKLGLNLGILTKLKGGKYEISSEPYLEEVRGDRNTVRLSIFNLKLGFGKRLKGKG